ncbi:MAG: alpha/beta fold hydrolase [Cyanobacteriota bacterium]|nr:alpha/beta fold hydrolase [Cyanobacteriota bacterium]
MRLTDSPPAAGADWTWQGHSIHYTQAGQTHPGRPALLLVHGFGASTDHWRKTIAGLQGEFSVWAIDLLGFGRSSKPNLAYSGDLWRRQLTAFIEEVIGEKTIIAGNSLGGYAALCVGADAPESVAGVILLNSAGPFSDQLHPKQPQGIQKLFQTVLRQPWASSLLFQFVRRRSNIRKTLLKVYVNPEAVTDQLVEEIYRPSCDPGAAEVFASVFKTPQGEPVDQLLARLQVPLLTLWGEGDPWMKVRERGAKFRQHYPQLQEHYLNSGHCPHDDTPELVNDLIRQWALTLT